MRNYEECPYNFVFKKEPMSHKAQINIHGPHPEKLFTAAEVPPGDFFRIKGMRAANGAMLKLSERVFEHLPVSRVMDMETMGRIDIPGDTPVIPLRLLSADFREVP